MIEHGSPGLSSASLLGLTVEHLAALRACAKGNSLRFESREIVNALIDAGYATQSYGIVRVTSVGLKQLGEQQR
jgi:hypothetical protein